MNPRVDSYIERSNKWPEEMSAVRSVLLECRLEEDIKWGKPCFSHEGANIAILQEMKGFLSMMFFKGALLDDPSHVLIEQGPNSRSAKRIEFTSVADVRRLKKVLKTLIVDAIRVEAAGLTVGAAPTPEFVAELRERLESDATFAKAFAALTPGRQREYNLHIASAKQPKTRVSRIDACAPKVLAGKGFRDV